MGLDFEEPWARVEETGRRGQRSPVTGIEFEFTSGRVEEGAEVEVEGGATNVLALGIPKGKEKHELVEREK